MNADNKRGITRKIADLARIALLRRILPLIIFRPHIIDCCHFKNLLPVKRFIEPFSYWLAYIAPRSTGAHHSAYHQSKHQHGLYPTVAYFCTTLCRLIDTMEERFLLRHRHKHRYLYRRTKTTSMTKQPIISVVSIISFVLW
jgi:hypothetical protein